MTYNSGFKVTAADYTTLVSTLDSVFGLGYGDSGYGGFSDGSTLFPPTPNINTDSLLPRVIGDQITADDWVNLKNAYLHCAAHQGVSLTVQQRGTDLATYTNGQSIFINGNEVFLTTGTNVGSAVTDINNASIPNVSATTYGPALLIISTETLTLAEGSGTALTDLGLVAGEHKILPDTVSIGEIIKYFVEFLVTDQSDALYRNDDLVLANKDSYTGELPFSFMVLGTSVRTTPWHIQLEHRFELHFSSQNEARAYFNTGGVLEFLADHTGGSATPQDTTWDGFLTALTTSPDPRNPSEWTRNPYRFNGANYFALTTSYQTFATYTSDVYFSSPPYDVPPMRWIIQAKTDTVVDPAVRGGKGTIITVRCIFQDQHTSPYGSGDSVDGTFTSYVTSRYADTIFHKSPPTYVSLVEITSGV